MRELVCLEQVNSPNVIKVREVIKTQNNMYFVMELANGGSLRSLLQHRKRLSEKEAKHILR